MITKALLRARPVCGGGGTDPQPPWGLIPRPVKGYVEGYRAAVSAHGTCHGAARWGRQAHASQWTGPGGTEPVLYSKRSADGGCDFILRACLFSDKGVTFAHTPQQNLSLIFVI